MSENYHQLLKFAAWFTSGNDVPVDLKYLVSRRGDVILAEANALKQPGCATLSIPVSYTDTKKE